MNLLLFGLYYIPRKRSRKTKPASREKVMPLGKTPFRLTPYWKNNDIRNAFLYIEEPENLRKMGSEKEELVMDIFVSRSSKSKLVLQYRKLFI